MAIAYFREAFRLSLKQAMIIGAASVFGGQSKAEAIDAELQPLLDATRASWQPSRGE